MGTGKATVLAVAICSGTIFSAYVAPHLSDRPLPNHTDATTTVVASPPVAIPVEPIAVNRPEQAAETSSAPLKTKPGFEKQLRPLLSRDVDFDKASKGFRDVEDFAAALHAARNIRVPFAALKQQMVDEGRLLPAAIQMVKPSADAMLEADLARSEARSDLAAIH